MKNLALYGLGGLTAVVVLAAIIKRKPSDFKRLKAMVVRPVLPGPKTYKVAKGDTGNGIAARFGTTYAILRASNGGAFVSSPGQVIMLPRGTADLGPRPKATGATYA